jgi:hypothetical protein
LLLIAIYAAVLVLTLAASIPSRRRILVKGRAFFILNLGFVVAGVAAELAGARFPTAPWLTLSAIALSTGWLARSRWVLLHVNRDETDAVVAKSLARVLVKARLEGGRFTLAPPARAASLQVAALPGEVAILSFAGDWHQNKARLAMAYLAKQFHGILPPIVIHLHDTR